MENYRQMWMSLRNDLSMRIREYRQADNIAGLDDYGLTELDAWEGIMQEIERAKENVLEFAKKNGLDIDESYPRSDWWKFRDERDSYKKQRDELINDMAEIKKKAEAFDEIDDLIVNGTLKDREPDAIFQNICHVIINFKERADNER